MFTSYTILGFRTIIPSLKDRTSGQTDLVILLNIPCFTNPHAGIPSTEGGIEVISDNIVHSFEHQLVSSFLDGFSMLAQ